MVWWIDRTGFDDKLDWIERVGFFLGGGVDNISQVDGYHNCSVLWMVGFGLVVWINEFGLFWGMYGFWVDVWIDLFGLGVWRIKRIGLVW